MACLFFVVDVLIWWLSQHISVKKAFSSRTERFGSFLFCFFYSHLGRPTKSTGPWDRRSQKKIDPRRKFSKLKKKKKNISEKKKKKKNVNIG